MLIEPSRDRAAERRDEPRLPSADHPVVLFACDFSAVSAAAVEAARAMATAFAGEIVALHVVPTTLPARGGMHALPSPALLRPDITEGVGRGLEGILQPARAAGIPARVLVREGRPADEVLQAAESMGASMIVVGTHGRRAIDRAFVGSMAEAVLRRAKCPILAVPPGFEKPPGQPWPRRILAATDFSGDSAAALASASTIVAKTGASLVAVHVLEEDAAAILSVAARGSADLIVIGASARRGLGRRLFGSTAMGVVRGATCPVLVVHH